VGNQGSKTVNSTKDPDEIFTKCRATLAKLVDSTMVVTKDEPDSYTIESVGPYRVGKRETPTLFYAAVMKNKSSIVLHFMPVYMNEPLKNDLPPEFLAKLKGKACFHFKSWDPNIEQAVYQGLEKGRNAYGQYRVEGTAKP
jgi:hypothetical protein